VWQTAAQLRRSPRCSSSRCNSASASTDARGAPSSM
jgi:hypothetical protein